MTTSDSKHGPSWGLVGAMTLLACSLLWLAYTANLHLDPWRAAAYADSYARKQGYNWPREAFTDNGRGGFACYYRDPEDTERFAVVKVRRGAGNEWEATLQSEFRPWFKIETASR